MIAHRKKPTPTGHSSYHLRVVALLFLCLTGWIITRLFILQIMGHNFYTASAMGSHEIYEKLHPHRGQIFFQDTRTKQIFPVAVNREYYLVYAIPKEIPSSEIANTSAKLFSILNITDPTKQTAITTKLSQNTSRYAPLAKKIDEATVQQLKAAKLKGIYALAGEYRYYPEEHTGSPVIGFTSYDDQAGKLFGQYGAEGYLNKELTGQGGFLSEEKGALGGWIALANRKVEEAQNGPDVVLTIDRTLEYKACERLRQGMEEYKAKSASLVLMNPHTGAILAMCSLPNFDPNKYSEVDSLEAFNNTAIFTAYEPGSVFKTMTIGMGLDMELITPATTYTDPCERVINGYHVHNADGKCYGRQTMTQVLEKSINTGAVWVEEQVGQDKFKEYIQRFGFGRKTNLPLKSEVAGDITSLNHKGEIFDANASFGQGLTVTPLQLTAAYAVVANGGQLPHPYIIDEMRPFNAPIEKKQPEASSPVISTRAAKLLSGMLTSVVENHYTKAKIEHYFVAGKTGTAQIPERGHYSNVRTNHTFAGFAPADNPQLVLTVKFEEPQRRWAEETTIPVFRDVMKFALEYYSVPGSF